MNVNEFCELYPEARLSGIEYDSIVVDDAGFAVNMRGHYTRGELLAIAADVVEMDKFFEQHCDWLESN